MARYVKVTKELEEKFKKALEKLQNADKSKTTNKRGRTTN
jgi:hypothetical protein